MIDHPTLFYLQPLVNIEDKTMCFSEQNLDQNFSRIIEEILAVSFFQNIQRPHRYVFDYQ